ncbi:MAG: ATP-binding protein [bacterium]
MGEFMLKLFDTGDFPARWHCGTWSEGHGWLHILSDLAIFGAYAAIPTTIAFFVLRRQDVPFPRIFWLFAAFIFSCGTTHLVEAAIFWQPVYRFSGLLKLTTAVVSWITVVALVRAMPLAMSLPGMARMNAELQAVNERLQAEVTERRLVEQRLLENAAALEGANAALQAKNQELADFTYMASHDLQEPLRKLVSFSELLKEDAGDALPQEAREDLAFITDAAERMKGLVNSLLRLSRVGQNRLQIEDVPVADAVAEALDVLSVPIDESGASVRLPETLPTLPADRALLVQLFQNLIGNAIKFVPAGAAPIIEITAADEEDGWIIGVRDHGIGLDPAQAEQIFVPFRRLHTRNEYKGSGIGLAICRKIVERHGGWIRVESQPGEGAHFRFYLGSGEPAPPTGPTRADDGTAA